MEEQTLYEYIKNFIETYPEKDKNKFIIIPKGNSDTYKNDDKKVSNESKNKTFMVFGTDVYEGTEVENIDKYKIKDKDEDKAYKYRYYAYFELIKQKDGNTSQKDEDNKILTFILFNPSYSNPENLDPTTQNCIKIAEKEEYSAIEIINLYPLRSSKPSSEVYKEEHKTANEINKNYIEKLINNEDTKRDFVLAWGTDKNKAKKAKDIIKSISKKFKNKTVKKISINKEGIDKVNASNNYIHPGSSLNIFGGVDSTELTDTTIE